MAGWQAPAAVAAAGVGFTAAIWLGYPLLTVAAARRRGARPSAAPGVPAATAPEITAVVATRDDPAVIARRVDNLLASDYPADRLRVVVAVDATAARPPAEYEAALEASVRPRVRVVAGDAPGGKAAALNAGVRAAGEADLLLFADSAQTFAPHTVRTLAERLAADPTLGAVSGLIVQPDSGDGVMDGFWRLEVELRKAQQRLHSIICVSGAVYALRRPLWRPMPAGLICDDLFVTHSVTSAGYRVALAPEAQAVDARVFTRPEHFARKVRTQVGLLQVIAWCPWVLRPGRNPMWAHLLGHKVLRVVTPALLAVAGVAALVALAAFAGVAVLAWAAAAALALLGVAYAARPRVVRTLLDRVLWLVRLQSAPLIALGRAVRGDWNVWRAARGRA